MAQNAFASAVITTTDWRASLETSCQNLNSHLSNQIDLLVLFVSAHFQTHLEEITECLQTQLSPRHLIGGTGESIVADAAEIETSPAISLWCASLPETQIDSMRLTFERTPDGGTFIGWPDSLGSEWEENSVMLLVGEPFSFPADGLLSRLGRY